MLLLDELMKRHSDNLPAAYNEFDSVFRDKEMTVQKTFDDFRVVVEETAGYNFPPKKSLAGMARIIDAPYMLKLFANKYTEKCFSLQLSDEIISQNNLFLSIQNGKVSNTDSEHPIHLKLTIYDLAQALLGYHTTEKEELFKNIFPEHQAQIHFMME